MTLTFTGTASGVPVPHRRHASLLVEQGSTMHLIDAGEGIAAALSASGNVLSDVACLWISHTHADHVSGLPMLLQAMHLAKRRRRFDILVPPGRELWFERWLEGMYMYSETRSFPLFISAYDTTVNNEDLLVQAIPNRHLDRVRERAAAYGVPSQAWSFVLRAQGCTLLVTSDIAGMEDIAEQLPGIDALVADSTHVPITELFALATKHPRLGMFCTHIPPELEPQLAALKLRSKSECDGRLVVAHDGMKVSMETDGTWRQEA